MNDKRWSRQLIWRWPEGGLGSTTAGGSSVIGGSSGIGGSGGTSGFGRELGGESEELVGVKVGVSHRIATKIFEIPDSILSLNCASVSCISILRP